MADRRLSLGEVLEFAKNGYITKLTNTNDDRYLWTAEIGEDEDGEREVTLGDEWYDHTQAKAGDRFCDGNNGDEHLVHAVFPKARRLVVENLGQHEGLYEMWYW